MLERVAITAELRLAYFESVLNRAASRNQSLDRTISSKAYYDPKTIARLGDQPAQSVQDTLNPLIDRALAGSNTSNFATGNQSGKVTSGGAPITVNRESPTGDDFVIENPDAKWVKGMRGKQTGFQLSQTPEPAPTPWTGPAGPLVSAAPGQPTAPAVNIMGGYGEGEGSAATPGLTGPDQSSLQHLGGYNAAINA